MEAWIAKTKVQSQWIRKHPTQILKQAKRVWDTSIHCGDGRAWVYFIFAICQWLPTNHCLYRKLPEGEAKIFCFLCLGRKTESVDHFFECPALGDEVHQLKVSVQRTLCESKFPLASLEVASWRENLICNWVSAASYLVSETLTRSKLQRIAWDSFMRAHKQFIGVRHFVERVALAVREQKQENAIPDHLAAVLVSCFNLGVEGSTDVLRRRVIFPEWYSESPNDSWFGSKGDPLQLPFHGNNTFLDLLETSGSIITQMRQSMLAQLDSDEPTRIVIIGRWDLFQQFCADKRVVQLALMETKNLSKFSVLLALNKASMIFDPISWSLVTTKFRDWADAWECKLQISDLTSSLFQERKLPTHQGRVRSLQISPQNHAYSFFDPMLYFQGKFERCFSPNLPPLSPTS